jgi:acetyl esterase
MREGAADPRLDPQVVEVLRRFETWDDLEDPTPAASRALDLRHMREFAGPREHVEAVGDRRIDVGDGVIDLRIYRPAGAHGILVWLHGGGWVVGSIERSDDQARMLANACGSVVASVGYRLAPEHPFPRPLEDCYAAVQWVHEHASELAGADAPLAVGGDSAGGNLAAAVCLMARDRGGPPIAFQLLVYPVMCRDFAGASRTEFAAGYVATARDMDRVWGHYLSHPDQARDPYASPLLASSFKGLPPAHVIVAECDLLRDEACSYVERLQAAGVPATLTCFDGMVHGFMAFAGAIGRARDGFQDAGAAVRAALAHGPVQ